MTTSSSSASRSASPPPPPQSHSDSPSPSPKHGRIILPRPDSKSSPPKRSPPLPWTHQETLAIIQAYQEKWYSLKKGQLKAFQWEEVAVTVAARCGFDEPSKTAIQCRHKIEKLRKRYRSELHKPYPNSWQYFELMDRMERGPVLLDVRPITVAKSFPYSNSNSDFSNYSHGYPSLYSNSTDYYNNGGGDSGGSDDSEEKWNSGHGAASASRNKSKSINNIVRGDVRFGRLVGNPMNVKQRHYYGSDDDENDSDDDAEEDGEDGGAEMALASEIRGFTERFMGMERKKIEMMEKIERYRMEMEKKKMEMIVEADRKMVDTIGRAFGAHKRAKISQDS